MEIPIIYELPLVVFVILAIYTIYSLVIARRIWEGGSLVKPYTWLIAAAVFFTLWGVDHLYHDLVPLSEKLKLFFHYGISHGFLLISMFCVAVSAYQTKVIAEVRNNVK